MDKRIDEFGKKAVLPLMLFVAVVLLVVSGCVAGEQETITLPEVWEHKVVGEMKVEVTIVDNGEQDYEYILPEEAVRVLVQEAIDQGAAHEIRETLIDILKEIDEEAGVDCCCAYVPDLQELLRDAGEGEYTDIQQQRIPWPEVSIEDLFRAVPDFNN